jgi:tetratricopeptide (TPR) repeat protein
MDEARSRLEEILAGDPRSVRGHNNLAAVDLVDGRSAEALDHFRTALDIDPSDAGVWLNLGVARYASGDTLGADEPLIEGIERSGGYAEACRLLGIPAEEGGARGAARKLTYEEARALLKEALRKVPTIGGPKPAEPPAGKDARVPDQTKPAPETRVAAARAGEKLEIQNVLYWKD